MFDVDQIARSADVIACGFAVLFRETSTKVVNLNTGMGAAVFALDGTLIETNRDDIEVAIARDVARMRLRTRRPRAMPKYYAYKVAGYFLYFTSKCIVEAFHVRASDNRLTEWGSAKLFVGENGQTAVMERGRLLRSRAA